MKLISSKPAKYAETIGRNKFIKLSVSRQHEYLACIARENLKKKDFPGFIKRYEEMHSWADLDRYLPPTHLSEEESLHEYFLFHSSYTANPGSLLDDEQEAQETESLTWEPVFDVTVVLDQVRSPYNVGSVLRLIDNFGFRRLVHNSEWLRLDHPQLCKSARGCQNWVPVEYKRELLKWLSGINLPIIGLETSPDAVNINKWQPEKSCVLIIGNEAYGIASELRNCCKELVEIPMFGFKKSMNLHHALAVIGNKITSTA